MGKGHRNGITLLRRARGGVVPHVSVPGPVAIRERSALDHEEDYAVVKRAGSYPRIRHDILTENFDHAVGRIVLRQEAMKQV